ncbi:MAG TPA: flagellar hook-basal body complex protein FliE [Clostridiales bacterium]|nr:flagellar hook-basal body complex protein FliE [Clostridiales bacterium]
MPISSIGNVNLQSGMEPLFKTNSNNDLYIPFKDVLKNAVDNARETQRVAEEDIINVLTGQTDDLHTVIINSVKAELALQTLVQLRNKALDSYNEIMRITL